MYMKIMISLSIMSLCWWRKNIIMLLLSLELMLISMFSLFCMTNQNTTPMFLLIMLTMMVSASTMGLSLLVSISHSHNSSNSTHINSLTFDKINYT